MKFLLIPTAATLALLFSCGGTNACEDYVTAVNDCYTAAGGEAPSGYDFETACSNYDNSTEDIYVCYTEAWTSGDCATPEGLTDISSQVTVCGQ